MTTDTGGRGFHLLVHTLAVARVAIKAFMAAIQLEAGARIVIKIPEFPIPHAVAILALCAQLVPVHIVLLVASVTGRRCLVLIEMSGMASYTTGCAMLSDKRVLRVSIVIKENRFPVLLVMTFLALQSKVGPMNVVFLVAGIALGRSLVFIETACVATLAFRLAMVTLERIHGIPIVLKEQDFPIPFRVAALALFAETTLMLVVLLVAGVTIYRRLVLIEMPLMARVALGQKVTPSQWIFCV
jgi:hypothetical protein